MTPETKAAAILTSLIEKIQGSAIEGNINENLDYFDGFPAQKREQEHSLNASGTPLGPYSSNSSTGSAIS